MQMASSSKQKNKKTPLESTVVDRLSTLPDDMLHRIFSGLDFVDVVRTSVLAKRWRYFWASCPYMNFSMVWFLKYNWDNEVEFVDHQYKFWDFIKWSLLLRDGGSKIIRLSVGAETTIFNQLNGIFRVAAKNRVRELCIVDGDLFVNALEFPRDLCESLTTLTLSFRDVVPLLVVSIVSNLTSLRLLRVVITQDIIDKLLSSDCTKLEDVHLEDCKIKDVEEINVSAGNLKTLSFVNVSTFKKFWVVGCFNCMIKISAPNLLSFCYIGPMLRRFIFADTFSLEKASIRLLRVSPRYQGEYNHPLLPHSLAGLNHAKSLILSSLVVKYFCPTDNEVSWDMFLLDNLSRLELEIRYTANHMEGLINLLKRVPNLEALFIRFKEVPGRPWSRRKRRKVVRRSSWESRLEDIACLSYHVKFIRISLLNGEEIALELVKFLLENGRVLEKMEILHISAGMKRKHFGKGETLNKASPGVVISFPNLHQVNIPWFEEGDSDPEYDDND